jgi:hypothetical protein
MNTLSYHDRILAEACLLDMKLHVKTLLKSRTVDSTTRGKFTDNIIALEGVIKYGADGGKVPWPVTGLSLEFFEKHGITHLIHSPRT